MEWYYRENGETRGPIEKGSIHELIEKGVIAKSTEVWRTGFHEWKKAAEVPGLFVPPSDSSASSSEPQEGSVETFQERENIPHPEPYPDGDSERTWQPMGYGGLMIRLGAFIVDFIVLLIPTFVAGFLVGFLLVSSGEQDMARIQGCGNWAGILVTWLYYAGFESSPLQATLGKKLLGLRVLDVEGNRISFARATGRHFAKILSALPLGFGFWRIPFNEKHQGWHDELARCVVVTVR